MNPDFADDAQPYNDCIAKPGEKIHPDDIAFEAEPFNGNPQEPAKKKSYQWLVWLGLGIIIALFLMLLFSC